MFGKAKKGLELLTSADDIWLKNLKPEKAFVEEMAADNLQRLQYLMLNYKIPREVRFTGMKAAVEAGATGAMEFLFSKHQFDFGQDSEADRVGARDLFVIANKNKNLKSWKSLCQMAAKQNSCAPDEDTIFKMALLTNWTEAVEYGLDRASPEAERFFQSAVHTCILRDDTRKMLPFVLTYTQKFKDVQNALNIGLCYAAERNLPEQAALLMAKGASPAIDGGTPIMHAALNENRELTVSLLQACADILATAESAITKIRQKKSLSPMIAFIEEQTASQRAEEQARKALAAEREKYSMPDPDTLAEITYVPLSGLKLTTLFNFKSRQQIFIAEKTDAAASLTMTVKSFDEIGNVDALEAASEKLAALGGNHHGNIKLSKAIPAAHRSLQS